MPVVHFLNVSDGDCSIIQHTSGPVTVIDVHNAFIPEAKRVSRIIKEAVQLSRAGPTGNFNQKAYPDNPIEYLRKLGVSSVFRFIATHADMDHFDGIKDFFSVSSPVNFWDTANTKQFEDGAFESGRYDEEDWTFYKRLRDRNPQTDPKRLVYYSGDVKEFYKHDGLVILAPTKELITAANEAEDWNDASYVILYRSCNQRILFAGDSEDGTWEHILTNWYNAVANVDVLIAPHHGRDSGRDWRFLDVVNPRLTLFGNANSEHLAYGAWNNRGLEFITNNQARYIVLSACNSGIDVYAKHETFARRFTKAKGYQTRFSDQHDSWYLGTLSALVASN
jgi:beta-lactamase superfamily II metal-dependent hydrolase